MTASPSHPLASVCPLLSQPPRLAGQAVDAESLLKSLIKQGVKCQIQTQDADDSYDA